MRIKPEDKSSSWLFPWMDRVIKGENAQIRQDKEAEIEELAKEVVRIIRVDGSNRARAFDVIRIICVEHSSEDAKDGPDLKAELVRTYKKVVSGPNDKFASIREIRAILYKALFILDYADTVLSCVQKEIERIEAATDTIP